MSEMFCSSCKCLEFPFSDARRKICVVGHVICQKCDNGGLKCVICEEKIENCIQIVFDNNTPRLVICPIPPRMPSSSCTSFSSQGSSSKASNDGHSDSLDSPSPSTINQIMSELNKCDNDTTRVEQNPIFGCFQVVGHKKDHVAYTLSLDVDHEKEKPESRDDDPYKNRSVSTSSSRSGLTFTTRSDCGEDNISYSTESVFQFFKNPRPIVDSETEDVASLPELEQLPPSFVAYRAKMMSVCRFSDAIPAQMEPLEMPHEWRPLHRANESGGRISRMPLMCPITTCKMITTPSDFCNHIFIDHPYIGNVKLPAGRVINFRLNLAENVNVVRCHRMFLLSGKKVDDGGLQYKNCLPFLLLTSKVNMRSLFRGSKASRGSPSDELTVVWLASVYNHAVSYCLNLWTHGDDAYIKSISTVTSSISDFRSASCLKRGSMLLTQREIERLKSDKGNTLLCQVIFG